MINNQYDSSYYEMNHQDNDRIALRWYARMIKKIHNEGPSFDFGAGTGHLVKRLPMPRWALDINKYSESVILRNAPETNFISNMNELSQENFKIITALHVVEHLTDAELSIVLNNFHKILAKDGVIIISTPALHGTAHRIKKNHWLAFTDETHINMKSSGDWIDVFQKANFKVFQSFADGYYDFPYGKIWDARNLKFLLSTLLNLARTKPKLEIDNGENNVFLLKLNN